MRNIIMTAAAAIALTGCANGAGVTPNYGAMVGLVQTDYAEIKVAAAAYCTAPHPDVAACAAIAKDEGIADPVVAALTVTSAPTSITAALVDAEAIMSAPLPTGALKPQTQADLNTALAVLTALAPIAGQLAPLL